MGKVEGGSLPGCVCEGEKVLGLHGNKGGIWTNGIALLAAGMELMG